ncbi:MAG: roadblock/LC7 domain-containing protein [Candidatus Methanofastidiosia archaeon]|jgi:predicted regulator of Ras-like GTPase activity (Roadblock/LC7/MglB family)
MKDEVVKMVTKIQNGILNRLLSVLKGIKDIEASSVASMDGFMIASELPHDTGKERVAVMSAVMLSLGKTVSRELGRGTISEVCIMAKKGSVVVAPSEDGAVLTAVIRNRDIPCGIKTPEVAEAV